MKKRMIIFGVNYFPPKGGTSRVVENLILQLKDKYSITVYCYKNPLAKDHIDGVNVVEFKPIMKGSAGSLFYFFISAVHILFRGKADFIHAHKTDCAMFIPLLRLRFKVVATSHEAPYKRDKWNFIQKAYFHLAEYIFIHSSNICTSISAPLTDYYEKKYNKKVYFIPNGINIMQKSHFDFKLASSFIPEKASLTEPFIFFSARRLMSTKGCHTMLEALNKIQYQGQIFITGELKETPYLQKLKLLSINLNVFFLGFVEPLDALLALVNAAQLFVFPSEVEGMSVMLLEVASVGVPIIASDIAENTQVFANEVLYFKCGNQIDLADKITYALQKPELMKALGAKAQELVYSKYLWSDISILYDKIYCIV